MFRKWLKSLHGFVFSNFPWSYIMIIFFGEWGVNKGGHWRLTNWPLFILEAILLKCVWKSTCPKDWFLISLLGEWSLTLSTRDYTQFVSNLVTTGIRRKDVQRSEFLIHNIPIYMVALWGGKSKCQWRQTTILRLKWMWKRVQQN